jgi:hypothetical protein
MVIRPHSSLSITSTTTVCTCASMPSLKGCVYTGSPILIFFPLNGLLTNFIRSFSELIWLVKRAISEQKYQNWAARLNTASVDVCLWLPGHCVCSCNIIWRGRCMITMSHFHSCGIIHWRCDGMACGNYKVLTELTPVVWLYRTISWSQLLIKAIQFDHWLENNDQAMV